MNKRLFKGAIAVSIAIVVLAIIAFVLALTEVFDINAFKLGFIVFTVGIGLVMTVYGFISKGGYETGVGFILLAIGLAIILIGVLPWWAIILIALAFLFIALLVLLLLKADVVIPKRDNEDKD